MIPEPYGYKLILQKEVQTVLICEAALELDE